MAPRLHGTAVVAVVVAALLLPVANAAALGSEANPAVSCSRILDGDASSQSGVYYISVSGSAVAVWCDMTTDGGGWTVNFKYDKSVAVGTLFDQYMPAGRLVVKGTAAKGAGTYTVPMAATAMEEVAIACFDANNANLAGGFKKMLAGDWVGVPWLTGAGFPSPKQQQKPFGDTVGYETLFWSTPSDWRELNLLDTSSTQPTHTFGQGWVVWRGGQAQCANANIAAGNQLVLMTREYKADQRLFAGGDCENNYMSIMGACPKGSLPFVIRNEADFGRLNAWAKLQDTSTSTYWYANAFANNAQPGYLRGWNFQGATWSYSSTVSSYMSGNGNSGCGGSSAGYPNYDPIPLQSGVGFTSRSDGAYLYIKCENLLTAKAVCYKEDQFVVYGAETNGNDDSNTEVACSPGYTPNDCRCDVTCDGAMWIGDKCRAYSTGNHGATQPVATCVRDESQVPPKSYFNVGGGENEPVSCPSGTKIESCTCHSYWRGCNNAGFGVVDTANNKCTGSGTRITLDARCSMPDNCVPNPCANGACASEVGGYSCTCDAGYVGTKCDAKQACPMFSLPDGAEVTCEGTKYNDKCVVACKPGYETSGGSSARQCQADKSWSGTNPTCTKIDCGQPPVPKYASVTCAGTKFGDKCTFKCDGLYTRRSGDLVRSCASTGQYGGSPLVCVANTECSTLKLGQTEATAGASCKTILEDAFSCGSTVSDGVYWIQPPDGSKAYRAYCDQTTDGGGWTYVGEPGRNPSDINDVYSEVAGGYHRYIYDLKGQIFDEVLLQRAGALWCNSWGGGEGDFIGKASMGVSVDKRTFNYFNGQFSPYKLVKQSWQYSVGPSGQRCNGCWVPSDYNNLNNDPKMDYSLDKVTNVGGATTGEKVKWEPVTKRNTYLEVGNYDGWIGYAGGCNSLGGGTQPIRAFVRGPVPVLPRTRSCVDIKAAEPTAPSGHYYVTPPGADKPFATYCDMNTGFLQCGAGLASGSSHSVNLMLASAGLIEDRLQNQWSRDCSELLVPGSRISFSKDPDAADVGQNTATLTSHAVVTSTHVRWSATGDTVYSDTSISSVWMRTANNNDCYRYGNDRRGPELATDKANSGTVCMNNAHYTGINTCECGNGKGGYKGATYTDILYIWVAPVSCSDKVKNGDESDIDCGGSGCSRCALGLACNIHADCQSGECDRGVCAKSDTGYALRMTGVGEHMRGSAFSLPDSTMTLEMWVLARNPEAAGSTLFDMSGPGGTRRATLSIEESTGLLRFAVDNGSGAGAKSSVKATESFPRFRWTHVAVTCAKDGTTTLRTDATVAGLLGPGSGGGVAPVAGARDSGFLVGRSFDAATPSFSGAIDDVRVWNSVVDTKLLGSLTVVGRTGLLFSFNFGGNAGKDGTLPALPAPDAAMFDAGGNGVSGVLHCESTPGCVLPALRSNSPCGDGFRQSEACDDGNTAKGDGCSDECKVEEGWICRASSNWAADVCARAAVGFKGSFEPDQDDGWEVTAGKNGAFVMEQAAARAGRGGARVQAAGGGSTTEGLSWSWVKVGGTVGASTRVRYLASLPLTADATDAVQLFVTVVPSSESPPPLSCKTDAACGNAKTFTMCYNTLTADGCDEVASLAAGWGVWKTQEWTLGSKFQAKYGASVIVPSSVKIYVGVRAGANSGADAYALIDEVTVSTSAADANLRAVTGSDASNERVVPWCPAVYAKSATKVVAQVGSSAATSKATCWEIKQINDAATSGIYYVHLGKGVDNAIEVYCDMETNGGGYMLFWKNIGGQHPGISARSNQALWQSNDNTVITPVGPAQTSGIYKQVHAYFGDMKGVSVIKYMSLYQKTSNTLMNHQRVRVELGPKNSPNIIWGNGPRCSSLPGKVALYSTRLGQDPTNVDYAMGTTDRTLNDAGGATGSGNSWGFGNTGHSSSDTCGASSDNLITDWSQLRRGCDNSNLCGNDDGSANTIRHLWSYAHQSSDMSASRCMYKCWGGSEDYNDVFVWAYREPIAVSSVSLVKAKVAENNYNSIVAGCENGLSPYQVTDEASFKAVVDWVKAQPNDGTYFYVNMFANNAEPGFINGDRTFVASFVERSSTDRIMSGNGNSGCGSSSGYPNYDPVPFQGGVGAVSRSSGQFLYITCESRQTATVLCAKPADAAATAVSLKVDGKELATSDAGANSAGLFLAAISATDPTSVRTKHASLDAAGATALTSFVGSASDGDWVVATFIAPKVLTQLPAAMKQPLADIGATTPTLTASTSWALIGRKGAELGSALAHVEHEPGFPADATTSFICPVQHAVTPDNAMKPRLPLAMNADAIVNQIRVVAGDPSGVFIADTAGRYITTADGGLDAVAAGGYNLTCQAASKWFSSAWQTARAQAASGSLVELKHSEDGELEVDNPSAAGAGAVEADSFMDTWTLTMKGEYGSGVQNTQASLVDSDVSGTGAGTTNTNPEWIQASFASVVTVTEFVLATYRPGGWGPTYTNNKLLQYQSPTSGAWTTLATLTGFSNDQAQTIAAGANGVSAQNFRVYSSGYLSLGTFRFKGRSGSGSAAGFSVRTDWQFSVSGAWTGGTQNTKASVEDANLQLTGWGSSNIALSFLQSTFPTPVTVGSVYVASYIGSGWGSQYTNGASIDYSLDGTAWTTAKVISGLTDTNGEVKFDITPTTARYWRVSKGGWLCVGTLRWVAKLPEVASSILHSMQAAVLLRAPDNTPNAGFYFKGSGAAQRGDTNGGSTYGGAVFAYDVTSVRVWTPSRANTQVKTGLGAVINVANGWGGAAGESTNQQSATADMKVNIFADVSADYDSGWDDLTRADAYKEYTHGLGSRPQRVRVLVRSQIGNNAGFVFEGIGVPQANGATGPYGGVTWAYSDDKIRVWGASAANGHLVHVGDGWAGELKGDAVGSAQVRVLAWTTRPAPDFEQEIDMSSNSDTLSFAKLTHGLGAVPEVVEVTITPSTGNNAGFSFAGSGMAQADGLVKTDPYGGVVYAWNDNEVRLWAPSKDNRTNEQPGYMVFVGSGWGNGKQSTSVSTAKVKVRVWLAAQRKGHSTILSVDVRPVARPPRLSGAEYFSNPDVAANHALTPKPAASAGRGGTTSFAIVAGNDDGVFAVDSSSGLISIKEPSKINPKVPTYRLAVAASIGGSANGVGAVADVAFVSVHMSRGNEQPHFQNDTYRFEVPEGSAITTPVGVVLATDENEEDTLLYSIVKGNDGATPPFKISICDGTIRVNDGALSIKDKAVYTLTVEVVDDGKPPKSDNATVLITLLDVNDAPVCGDNTWLSVDENSPAGTMVGTTALNVTDPEADPMAFEVFSGTDFVVDASTGVVRVGPNAVLDFETRPSYGMVVKVTDKPNEKDEQPLSVLCAVTVKILNVNDPPHILPSTKLVVDENAPADTLVGTILTADQDSAGTVTVALVPGSPGSGFFTVESSGAVVVAAGAQINYETDPTFTLHVRVTDQAGAWAVANVTVIVRDMPDPPRLADWSVTVPENLDWSALVTTAEATDDDNGVLTYSMSVDTPAGGVPPLVIDPNFGTITVGPDGVLDYEAAPGHIVRANVTVTDNSVPPNSVTAKLAVVLTDRNDPPAVSCDAGLFYWSSAGSFSAVSGVLRDPDLPPTGMWNLGGLDPLATRNASMCEAACMAMTTGKGCGAWTLFDAFYPVAQLRGRCIGRSDDRYSVAFSDLWVHENFAVGLVTSGRRRKACKSVTLAENPSTGATIVGAFSAVDPEGDTITWSLVSGQPASYATTFAVATSDGVTTMKSGGVIDYEDPKLKPVRLLLLQAADPNNATEVAVKLTVTNVNEPPIVPATASANVGSGYAKDETVGLPLFGRDPEGGATAHSITAGNSGGEFRIDPVTGQLITDKEVTASVGTVFTLTITAKDPQNNAVTTTFTVTVVAGNLSPVVDPGQVRSVPENSAAGTKVGAVVSLRDRDSSSFTVSLRAPADGDASALSLFDIDGTGQLTVKSGGVVLDYEARSSYRIEVVVTDQGPGNLQGAGTVVINVTNVNEPPACQVDTVDANSFTIAENSDLNTPVGASGGGTAEMVACVDPEGAPLSFVVTATAPTPAAMGVTGASFAFQAVNASGADAGKAFYLTVADKAAIDFERSPKVSVTVRATDPGNLFGDAVIPVRLVDVNEPPAWSAAQVAMKRNASEALRSASVVTRVVAVDPERGRVTYALAGGTDTTTFDIDRTNGDVLLTANGRLDFEDAASYDVTVEATDGDGEKSLHTFTIQVLDANDVTITDVVVTGTPSVTVLDPVYGVIIGARVPTVGGTSLTMTGTNFGFTGERIDALGTAYDPRLVGSYAPFGSGSAGYSLSSCRVSINNTQVQCLAGEGAGGLLAVSITVGGPGGLNSGNSFDHNLFVSYRRPAVTNVTTSVGPLSTAGGEDIVITGTDFGPVGTSVSATYGDALLAAVECKVTTAHTQITCKSNEGTGTDLRFVVTVAGQSSEISGAGASVSYAKPKVATVAVQGTAKLLATRGGNVVVLTGLNFGAPPKPNAPLDALVVSFGETGQENLATCTVTKAHTELRCVTPAGAGKDLAWVVRVQGSASEPSATTVSYEPPVVTGVYGPGAMDASTAGGEQVFVEGASFGPKALNLVERVNFGRRGREGRFEATDCDVITSDTLIRCVTPPGTGKDHSWIVTVRNQTSAPFAANTSYAAPTVSYFEGDGAAEAATEGLEGVVIHGRNFGADDTTIQVVDYSMPNGDATFLAINCTVKVPHTELSCLTAPGAGSQLAWSVVVDGQVSATPSTDYAAPTITAVAGVGTVDVSSANTDGGERVRISGTNFGPPGGAGKQGPFVSSVTYGARGDEYKCTDLQVLGHTALECTTSPGLGSSLAFTVTVALQRSALSTGAGAMLSYAPPVLSHLTPTHAPAYSENAVQVRVNGTNFALSDPTAAITVLFGNLEDGTQSEVPVVLQPAVGGTHAVVFNLPSGVGADRAVRLRLRSLRSRGGSGFTVTSDALVFSYDAPRLQGIDVSKVEAGVDPANEIAAVQATFPGLDLSEVRRLRIVGTGFGLSSADTGDTVQRRIMIQPTDRDGIALPGAVFAPANSTLFLWTDTEITAFSTFRYGNLRLELHGINHLGRASVTASQEMRYADFSPRLGLLSGQPDGGFDTRGGQVLTIPVEHLGSTNVLQVIVGNRTCAISTQAGDVIPAPDIRAQVITDKQDSNGVWTIYCVMPAGEGAGVVVTVVRDGVSSADISGANRVKYAQPTLTTVRLQSSPGGGAAQTSITVPTTGAAVRVEGINFGLCPVVDMGFAKLWYPGCPQPALSFIAGDPSALGLVGGHGHTFVEFKVPPGQGKGITLQIVTAGQAATTPFTLNFMPPAVTSVMPVAAGVAAVGTAGGPVRITGTNFGVATALSPDTPVVTFINMQFQPAHEFYNTLKCLNVVRLSHTELTCTVPPGGGVDMATEVVLAGQVGTASSTFSYAAPSITKVAAWVPAEPATIADWKASKAPGYAAPPPQATSVAVAAPDSGGTQSAAVLRGPTRGGYLVVVNGTDFGGGNSSCVVLTDSTRVAPHGTTGEVTCKRKRSASDPYAAPTVIEHSHTGIAFLMPEGMGSVGMSVVVWGQAPAVVARFEFSAPHLVGLEPAHGPTDGGSAMTLLGASFGADTFAPRYSMQVVFGKTVCSDARDKLCEDEGSKCPCTIETHGHDQILMKVPGGIGRGIQVRVRTVDGAAQQASLPVVFNYDPPEIIYLLPYDADARGQSITIPGRNFGRITDMDSWEPHQREVRVQVHGVNCTDAKRDLALGASIIRCVSPAMTVGPKNLTLTVAGQAGHMPYTTGAFFTICRRDFYGQIGEVCNSCPVGATCAGGYDEPRSVKGFFKLNGTEAQCKTEERKASLRAGLRPACALVVACEPPYACLGDNKCEPGYKSKAPMYRCSTCDDCYKGPNGDQPCKAYYKRDGDCVECPDNPLLLVAVFIVMALLACAGGYILNRNNVHLAFVSIGVDYFQVLAMFARSRVKWPQLIKDLFHIMSIFNFNLEITAPECSIPEVTFELKWYFIQALPLGACAVFLIMHIVLYIKKRVCLGRRKKLHTHISAMIATGAVMFYFLYLYLARSTLDVFNCAPTDPPDGFEYLQAEFVPCGEPGGLQLRLLPLAIIALLTYVLGYPLVVGSVLFRNRMLAMEDQLLRAKGVGDERLTNPNCYDFRKRWSKMYYHFRPDKFYWILFILGRKFLIAFTALMFNRNPAFQLSCALLVMFASYSLQVKYRPYMSPSERTEVLDAHEAKVAAGDPIAEVLDRRIRSVAARSKKRTRRADLAGAKTGAERARALRSLSAAYFWNYNTVEMVLLGCAVLVNLAGIMFESGRFESEFYQEQRDAVTVMVMLIIIVSITYFFIVLSSEIWTAICVTNKVKSGKATVSKDGQIKVAGGAFARMTMGASTSSVMAQKRATKRASGAGMIEMSGGDTGGPVGLNPLFAASAETGGKKEEGELSKEDVGVLLRENAEMANELKKMKNELERMRLRAEHGRGPGARGMGASRGRGGGRGGKKEFSAQPSRRAGAATSP